MTQKLLLSANQILVSLTIWRETGMHVILYEKNRNPFCFSAHVWTYPDFDNI